MIRISLPFHLRTLAKVGPDIAIEVEGMPTLNSTLDALEDRYPVLSGTIRDHITKKRRLFLRFYACEQDLSNEPLDSPLPEKVRSGEQPLLIIGAIAGG